MKLEEITQQYVKEKLTQLPKLLPNEDENVYIFAKYVADRLKDDDKSYHQLDFLSDADHALKDLELERETDKRRDLPMPIVIRNPLARLPEEKYNEIRIKLADIAAAIYGKTIIYNN